MEEVLLVRFRQGVVCVVSIGCPLNDWTGQCRAGRGRPLSIDLMTRNVSLGKAELVACEVLLLLSDDSFAFLLTTRAGGVGINLTSASVVVDCQ